MNTIKCFGKVGNDWWYHSGERNTRNQNITRQQGMAILAAAQDANVSMRAHYHGIYTTFHFDDEPFNFNDGVPVAVFPGAIVPAGRRIVMVQPLNGEPIKDEVWAAGDDIPTDGPKCGKVKDLYIAQNVVMTDYAPTPDDTIYDFLTGTGRL